MKMLQQVSWTAPLILLIVFGIAPLAGRAQETDVPYVPAPAADWAFQKGLDLLGKALHGLLVGSSKKA